MALKGTYKKFEVEDYKFLPDDTEVIWLSVNNGQSMTGEWFTIEDAEKIIKKIEKAIAARRKRESEANGTKEDQ